MKKVKEIVSQIPKYTAYSFSMSMVVFMAIGLVAGIKAIPVSRIVQLLFICVAAAVLQMIAFSDICIKKMAYTKRLAIFMFPFLIIITAFAVMGEWFPTENIGAWITFIGIFIACFAISTLLFEIHFRITGNKYTGILNEYKNKKK